MNEVQRAAIARADASTKPALDLYAARSRLMHLSFDRLKLADLNRVNDLLSKLTDDEIRQVASFAEGLAEWRGS